MKLVISSAALAIILLIFGISDLTALAQESSKLIFYENFENGLSGWDKEGSSIDIVKSEKYGQCLRISRTNRRNFTYVTRQFTGYSGTLICEAMVQSENVVCGSKDFHRGKFQAVIIVDGKEVDWPDDDFKGTFGWSPKKFKILDLDGTESVFLRVGLQNAKGVMYIDEIKVFHQP